LLLEMILVLVLYTVALLNGCVLLLQEASASCQKCSFSAGSWWDEQNDTRYSRDSAFEQFDLCSGADIADPRAN
jgi:hypothetical protein